MIAQVGREVEKQRIPHKWRPFLQGAKIMEQKTKTQFPIQIKTSFFSLPTTNWMTERWPDVSSHVDSDLRKGKVGRGGSLCFLEASGILPESPQVDIHWFTLESQQRLWQLGEVVRKKAYSEWKLGRRRWNLQVLSLKSIMKGCNRRTCPFDSRSMVTGKYCLELRASHNKYVGLFYHLLILFSTRKAAAEFMRRPCPGRLDIWILILALSHGTVES